VFGPFPGSRMAKLMQYTQIAQRQGNQFNQSNQSNQLSGQQVYRGDYGKGAMPQKYMQPGVVGSQVPKYKAAPDGSITKPGVDYRRVTKIDKKVKKILSKKSYIT